MGDNSHSCRGFETPTLGSDLWPMGFDVDLALDGPGARKGPGGSLSSGGLGNGGLSSLQSTGNTSVGGGYNDIHHLSGLSSILQRFDDLHAGDICQMTELTNSLPKGDSETAQSLLAKLACQDLGPDLSSGADPSHKELESSLFDQATNGMGDGAGNNTQGVVLSHKTHLESADVYGRMTCYGGKLVLQLRHINLNTNYTLNVSECWLCGEKVNAGSQLCTHKHSLNGLFQVNDEFVQMDIDHYIIPEQALDPPDGQDMTDTVLQHSDSSGLHHDLNTSRDLELPENLTGGGDGLNMGAGHALHYTPGPDAGLVPPLSSTSNLMSSTIPVNHNSCLNSSFGQLPLPAMPITSSHTGMNTNIPGMVTGNVAQATMCSVSTPVFGLTHTDPSSTNTMLPTAPSERKGVMQNTQVSLANTYHIGNGLNNFNVNNQMGGGSIHSQPTHRDIAGRNKQHTLQYPLTFSTGGEYSCHASTSMDTIPEKPAEVPCLTPLHSVSTSFNSRLQRTEVAPRKTEIGAKKRKSRAQRKPSVIQMRDYKTDTPENSHGKIVCAESLENLHVKNYNLERMDGVNVKNESAEHMQTRPDASIEDWIKHNLPERDLIVTDNKMKHGDGQKTSCEFTEKFHKPHIDHQKTREPDQTSRLAAHMLTKGLDLSCRLCPKDFGRDIRNYKIHMKEHGLEEMALFACSFCTKTFAKGKHYTQHLKTHVRTRRFSCRLCNANYSREAKLRRHMLSHSQEHQEKEHKCSKCPKSFSTKEYLQAHLKVHGGKKYKCETCGFLCSSMFNLETHRKKHLGDKPFKCELCEKTFVRRDFLDNHMEQVHKNKKSKCQVCGKLFSRKDVLKRHLAVHNNETYDCEICGKKFSRKDRLATHRKSHKLNCDYKCSLCPASFTRKNVLDKHEKVHKTKEQCKVCYKFLLSKQRLESHMKLHARNSSGSGSKDDGEGMLKCDICDKSLTSKDILRKHMRKIHGKLPEGKKKVEAVEREKKFVCHFCSKGFTRSCNLSTHLLKAHSKVLEEDEFDDDLPSVLQSPKLGSVSTGGTTISNPSSSSMSTFTTLPYHAFSTSSSTHSTVTTSRLSGANQSIRNASGSLPFPITVPASSPSPTASHPPPPLQLSGSHFPSSGPPDSPINLSTEAITAAAYLLAYPSYPGPY
ncbi:uncharacterized protein LOC121854298 [Homarus americanus]|uniref:Zinc finger protein 112-like 2 n=1 Tax=Homarus americanus TaxID=6706 RepID=A0A8J5JI01_HOMAM|nr:uncharacterized protein LOC121854298 [Homarus americanus]KAG7155980.1 Zinc finger protein 112-like 2 [Homarus americanus]